MRHSSSLLAFLAVALVAGSSSGVEAQPKTQTLCGLFLNPTPGNAWLQDRGAEWTVGIQGGHQAEGDWPEFGHRQWIKTNRGYGYGCACIKGIVDSDTREIITIVSARAQPLEVCRNDRALKKPPA